MAMDRMTAGLLGLVGTGLLSSCARGAAGSVLTTVVRTIAGGGKGGGSGRGSGRSGASGAGQGSGRGGRGQDSTNPLEKAVKELFSPDRTGRGARRQASAQPGQPVIDVTTADAPAPAATPADETVMDAELKAEALQALLDNMASLVEGRARLRHQAFRDAVDNADLTACLQDSGCFTSVQFTPGTGSVLLHYDASRVSMADFLEAALPLGLRILGHR